MSSAMRPPIVWMNVTTSAGWTRPPVGIVRVERALAEQLQLLFGPERMRLCVWRDNRFIEWTDSLAEPGSARLGQALDVILPRTASFDLARPFLLRALQRYQSAPRTAEPNEPVRMAIPLKSSVGLQPSRGDFLISAGLDWEHGYTARFHAMSRSLGLRVISCCYDLIPVLFPHYCVGEVAQRFTEYFSQLCWGSEAVMCISRQSENDLKALCAEVGAPLGRTAVIPLGDNVPGAGGPIGDEVRQVAAKPYILFVSTIERRKNHEVLYRAYHLLARRGYREELPKLVFVGMPGWGVGDLLKDLELDPIVQGLVVQLHHVSDSELNHLYQHAQFCVYPSLYEGWGLPIGEALAMGKAVIASDRGSIPEVGGDLVRYREPWNAPAWADAIIEWVRDPQLVRQAERAVRQGYKPRQWAETARVVKSLIDSLPPIEGPLNLRLTPGYDMSTAAGIHVGPALQATGTEGVLMFGPHWSLPAGRYEARVAGHAGPGSAAQAVAFDVASRAGQQVHAKTTVSPAGGQPFAVTLPFTIDQDVDDIELRCRVLAGSTARIDHVQFVSVPLPHAHGRSAPLGSPA